jgi:hypothetical protein
MNLPNLHTKRAISSSSSSQALEHSSSLDSSFFVLPLIFDGDVALNATLFLFFSSS